MSVEIIDTLKQKNSGTFPIAMASDIHLDDGTSVEAKVEALKTDIDAKVSTTDYNSFKTANTTELGKKADKTALDGLASEDYVQTYVSENASKTVDLTNYVNTTSFTEYQTANTAELNKKADKTALANYVDSSSFTEYQTANTAELNNKADKTTLANYVTTTDYNSFKTTNTTELGKKADKTALANYVDSSSFTEYQTANTVALNTKANTVDVYTKTEIDDNIKVEVVEEEVDDDVTLPFVTQDDLDNAIDSVNKPIVNSTETTISLSPNKMYIFGTMSSLNITLTTPTNANIVNEYMLQFTSGETATTFTYPSTILWVGGKPTILPNKTYQCSILNNIGVIVGA